MADATGLDAEHPWPWLEAFPESAQAFFNGRDEEKAALLRCVLSAPVTVLFGKSGLGKSSLLQAGLFPKLREQRLLPVYRRIDHDANAVDLSVQLAKRWAEEIHLTQTDDKQPLSFRYKQPADGDDEAILLSDDLWSDLHRDDIELVDGGGRVWQPVFVLDQFEEMFTRGAQQPERMQQWLFQLGDLLENRIPSELAEKLNDDEGWCDQLNFDIQPYRFLLSLREDYLAELEEWSELIPRLAQNRFRLAPMSRDQATQAVERTGGSLVNHADAKNIVQYLSQTKNQTLSCSLKTRGPGQIEPALLGLLCAGLNDERLRAGQAKLNTDNLAQAGGQIVERFYDQALQGLPAAVGEFVEQFLITADGVRLAYPADSIVAEKRVSAEQLQTVIDRRLLRRESLESGDRIELVHDRLAQVALRRRQDSERRREQEREQRRRRQWLFGTISALLLFAGVALYMWRAKQQAVEAEQQARRAEISATAIRIGVEGNAITSGVRPGGTLVGLLKVLSSHRIVQTLVGHPVGLVDESLQTEYLKFPGLLFLREMPDKLTSVGFSPDGKTLVTGSWDKSLRLWDVVTGHQIGVPLEAHDKAVLSVAFSSDGKRFASGSGDNSIRIWALASLTAAPVTLNGHDNAVLSLGFSPDGRSLVSGGGDNTLLLWDLESNSIAARNREGGFVSSVTYSPDGKSIVSASENGIVRLRDSKALTEKMSLLGHSEVVWGVAFSPDGNRIASASWDKSLRLWSSKDGKLIGSLGHDDAVWSLAFSPDDTRIISASTDEKFRVWDAKTGEALGSVLSGHIGPVRSIAFTKDGSYLASGGWDGTLRIWKADFGKALDPPVFTVNDAASIKVISPDNKILVTSKSGELQLYNLETGQPIGDPMAGHNDYIAAAAFSPDGKMLVTASADHSLRLWDVGSRRSIGDPLQGHSEVVTAVAFCSDGKRIVSGSKDKTVRLWDVRAGKPIRRPFEGHLDSVSSVLCSTDGQTIVSGSLDNTIRLWNSDTGMAIGKPLNAHTNWISMLAISPSGKQLVSASGDRSLRVWDVDTGDEVGTPMRGHTESVEAIAFSPDGKRIVSGSWDKSIRIWDVETGALIGTPLMGHDGAVTSVAFSSDGSQIISASNYDKTLRTWPVFDGWADQLCKKLPRNLSRKEWRDWVSADIDYIEQCPGLPIPPDPFENGATATFSQP
ncbi:hypothetical protein [Methylomonas sp. HYX-M1]|uniref:WD40 repeat domain-containing protein n=1 Tax=Methylomonas sp. HYX-M1 TaxID=3139307 RepID=UPI00345C00FB